MSITSWPGLPVFDSGSPFLSDKADQALSHLYDYKEIIPCETRSNTSAWSMTENDINTLWSYSGSTDVVWTLPDGINSNTNGAKYLIAMQESTGRITLNFGSGFTGAIIKPAGLTTVQTAGSGRALYALLWPSPLNKVWVRSD